LMVDVATEGTFMNRHLMLPAFACFLVLGCGGAERSAPPKVAPVAVDAPALSPDEKVLMALDAYDPVYQVNAKGRITRLKIPWRHLPDSILTEINKLTELDELDCYATTLSDDGLAKLKDLQKLRAFGLQATALTGKAIAHLERMRGLRYVWLTRKLVGDDAVERLNEARPDLTVYLD
jgi:hypothetical protein